MALPYADTTPDRPPFCNACGLRHPGPCATQPLAFADDDAPFFPDDDAQITAYCGFCGKEHAGACPMLTESLREARAARRMLGVVLVVFAGLAVWAAWWGLTR